MVAPEAPRSRRAGILFLLPLFAAYVLLAPTPCPAEPIAVDDVATLQPIEAFDPDPLSKAGPEGGPRVPPPGTFTVTEGDAALDWAQRIDQAWGPSPWTIDRMLTTFDEFWNAIDRSFACFQGLDVDWTAVRSAARAEIQAGVSRGRFAAIMNHAALALRESHTVANDMTVNFSQLLPGVPLFVVGGWGDNRHFRAGLTPLPDSSLLVYKAAPAHPLGLVAGDIVLGYGGVPWKHLYRELLAARLPLTGWWWGSTESSWTHSMLMSAGLNWHLFDTIDVVKYASGDTVHLSVAPLAASTGAALDCTEQLRVPGVAMPSYLGNGDPVSWGIVTGTRIGYVYVRAWAGDAGTQLLSAVSTLLTLHQTEGLIFDFRTNYGGNMFLAYPALNKLFGRNVATIGFASRCSATDHLGMCASPSGPPSAYVIHGTAVADYDRPIAVLVGPGALSSGDQVAHLFRFHPQARFFGKSTATAFNAPTALTLGTGGWSSRFAIADAYRLSDPSDYLTHDELRVDEPVWLTPDDVARGVDTVAETAIRWITNEAPVCDAARAAIETSWSVDHRLMPVTIEGVTDPDGDPVTVVATAVAQDEPVNGTGDGDTCPDALIEDGVARVRRERAGDGDGRIYEVSFTASDGRGGESQGTVRVCVPHDRGKGRRECRDDGERYDALTCASAARGLRAAAPTRGLRTVAGQPGATDGGALHYHLPRDGWVDLGLHDVAGRRLVTLVRAHQAAGEHELTWSRDGLQPGVYFALLRLDHQALARTTIVVR